MLLSHVKYQTRIQTGLENWGRGPMSEAVSTLLDMTLNEPEFPRFIYVPWIDNEPQGERASQVVSIAKAVAAKARIPLLGVAATAQQLPDDWGKTPYRTRRSRTHSAPGPAVEVYFWPALDLLASMPPSRAKHAFILEWGSDDLSGWARHAGAVHFDEKRQMSSEISAVALELYESIDWSSNNSWGDKPGKRDALRDLRRLKELGELDPIDLSGYMIDRHGDHAIKNLLELARKA